LHCYACRSLPCCLLIWCSPSSRAPTA
jgi:hypothetical protein